MIWTIAILLGLSRLRGIMYSEEPIGPDPKSMDM